MNRSTPITFLATAAAILLIAVGVASCGGSSGSSSNSAPAAKQSQAAVAAKPAPAPAAKPAKQASPTPPPAPAPRRQLPRTASPRVTWATTIPTTTAAPMTATEASRVSRRRRAVIGATAVALVLLGAFVGLTPGDQRSHGPPDGAFAWLARPAAGRLEGRPNQGRRDALVSARMETAEDRPGHGDGGSPPGRG